MKASDHAREKMNGFGVLDLLRLAGSVPERCVMMVRHLDASGSERLPPAVQ